MPFVLFHNNITSRIFLSIQEAVVYEGFFSWGVHKKFGVFQMREQILVSENWETCCELWNIAGKLSKPWKIDKLPQFSGLSSIVTILTSWKNGPQTLGVHLNGKIMHRLRNPVQVYQFQGKNSKVFLTILIHNENTIAENEFSDKSQKLL